MIGEVGSGSSFRGLVHYLAHGRADAPKTPPWLQPRNLFALDPDDARQEMAATAAENPRVQRPVLHLMVSPAADDRLARDDWSALADRVLGDLGLGEHQAFVVLHSDTETPHLHIAVNRVHPETLRAWDAWRSKTRLEAILRSVEREWGLRRVPGRLAGPERHDVDRRLAPPLSVGEQAQLKHQAAEPQVLRWRRALTPHFEEATSWSDLGARLKANGLQLAARGRGLVVTDGERFVKASRLGRAYSRGRLEARFGQSFADWRTSLEKFREAAALHPHYLARSAGHPRATATARVLQRAGRKLGWQALGRLEGPMAPAVASLVAGARRLDHELAQGGTWDAYARRHLRLAILRSQSWAEAEGRLRLYGAWIVRENRAGGELHVTDGAHTSPLRRLGADFAQHRLDARLGPWSAWEHSRRQLHQAVQRYTSTLSDADARTQRWHRLAGLIRASERRLERFEATRTALAGADKALRQALASSDRRTDPVHLEALLRRLRLAGSRQEVERHLRGHTNRRLGRLLRSEPSPQLLAAAERYRRLAHEVRRLQPPARSASRRLRSLRRRARLLSPTRRQQAARGALAAAARPLLGIGVRSLLARAAPGLGPALSVLRAVRPKRRERELER